jgi:hypothetical protein
MKPKPPLPECVAVAAGPSYTPDGLDGTKVCRWPKKMADAWCHGCKRYICENHSINPSVFGHGHDPLIHLKWEDAPDE